MGHGRWRVRRARLLLMAAVLGAGAAPPVRADAGRTQGTPQRVAEQPPFYPGAGRSAGAGPALYDLLLSRWEGRDAAPTHVRDDLAIMAAYFSTYPETIALLRRLAHLPWRLRYRPGQWTTRARISALAVQGIRVYFDTRLGAQLRRHPRCAGSRRCLLTPADALLHELLHVQAMLQPGATPWADGGAGVLYPHRHEAEVMRQERRLFAALSTRDGLPRPQRRRHSGRLLAAPCPLCVPAGEDRYGVSSKPATPWIRGVSLTP